MDHRIQTEWGPLKSGGANFATHKLVRVDRDTLAFRPTWGALAFYLIFLVTGLGAVVAGLLTGITDTGFVVKLETVFLSLFGLAFTGVGGALLHFGTKPVVFDRRRDYFWKGRKDPDAYWNRRDLKDFANLDDIRALQLLTEHVSSDKGSYRSYELNLVLVDGSRLNVTDHGKLDRIVDDARALSEFLDVPLLGVET